MGDVLLEAPWQQPPAPAAELFEKIRARLAAADLVVCNLEEPLTDWPHPTRHKKRASVEAGRDYILRATSPDAARELHTAGIRIAGLANNHTMDYTERGLLETIERLTAVGILPVGGGENLASAEQVRVIEVQGLRIGFLSFSDVVPAYYWAADDRPGIASSKDVVRLRAAIDRARPAADLLVVIFHWGKQGARHPSQRQQQLAQQARRAGADLILGAHPHVLQGVGCLGRVPVVYSAGNFVFPTRRVAAQRSAIFEIEFASTRQASVRVVPVVLDPRGAPHPAEGTTAQAILGEMNRLSAQLGMGFTGDTGSCSGTAPAKPQRMKARRTHTQLR